jgi:hypothetical protein
MGLELEWENMKQCVISLATKDKDFQGGIKRLEQSLKRIKFRGDVICWNGFYPQGCPSHMRAPFAFKTFCFMEARKKGYDLILWVDSSGVVIRRLESIFRVIEQEGYLFVRNASLILGEYCSDEALRSFGMSRDQALKLPEAMGAVIGLNMQSKIALEFLEQWHAKAADGFTFRGGKEEFQDINDYEAIKHNLGGRVSGHPRVRGHMFDQAALSILAHQLGLALSDAHIATSKHPFNRKTIIYIDRDVQFKTKPFNRVYLLHIFTIIPFIRYLRKAKKLLLRAIWGLFH